MMIYSLVILLDGTSNLEGCSNVHSCSATYLKFYHLRTKRRENICWRDVRAQKRVKTFGGKKRVVLLPLR